MTCPGRLGSRRTLEMLTLKSSGPLLGAGVGVAGAGVDDGDGAGLVGWVGVDAGTDVGVGVKPVVATKTKPSETV